MDIRNRLALRQEAARSLRNTGHRKWIVLHTGITLAVGLVLALVNELLDRSIGTTGGLSGVGLRAVLSTVQSVLMLVQLVAMPFWQMGWVATGMGLARGQEGSWDSLLTGFRRFGPVLRLNLLQSILFFGIMFASSYAGMTVFMMTPLAMPLMELMMEEFPANADPDAVYAAMTQAMGEAMVPMLLICLAIFLVAAGLVFYRIRLAGYCLLDSADGSALGAIRKSAMLTKKNAGNLFRLDCSFWWFYLLELLVGVVAYLDILLLLAGVSWNLPQWVSSVGVYLIYAACQLGLYWWRKTMVDAAYVKAYDALRAGK